MLAGRLCTLRPFRDEDVARLPALIGDLRVVRWMSHRIPHPYGPSDARAWVDFQRARSPVDDFAIEVEGLLAGGAGLMPHDGGENTGLAQIGYWLAPPWWGRGIATDAARTLSAHALRERGFRKLTAWVFEPNVASARVLERAGFTNEGHMRSHFTARDGEICDGISYGRLATDPEPA